MPQLALAIACGYLLGSIPFAYLVARANGVNIFMVGTRNPGAANVFRSIGAIPGSIVFIADVAKGATAVVIAALLIPQGVEGQGLGWFSIISVTAIGSQSGDFFVLSEVDRHPELLILPGLAAIVGHWFPVFLRFRGGAGLATAIGVALGMLPLIGLASITAGLLTQYRFRSSGHSAAVGLAVYVGIASALGYWAFALAGSSAFAAVFGYYLVARSRGVRGDPDSVT